MNLHMEIVVDRRARNAHDTRVMKTKEKQIPLQTLSEFTLDTDAQKKAEQLMSDDDEQDFMRFIAGLIAQATLRNN